MTANLKKKTIMGYISRHWKVAVYFFVALCVSAVALSMSARAVDEVNLIANPSAETIVSGLPKNWVSERYGTNSVTFTAPAYGFDGTKSLRVQMTGWKTGDAEWYFDEVPVTAGTKYTFSNYYRASVATSIDVQFKLSTGKYKYVNLGSPAIATNWTKTTYTFTVPANAVAATVMHSIAKNGYVETDMYSLSKQSTSSPTPSPTSTATPTPTPVPTASPTPTPTA
ncbi:MAG: carbohydrate binding domain-containing protein, partial [Candidatus Woesebacteria bacterium]